MLIPLLWIALQATPAPVVDTAVVIRRDLEDFKRRVRDEVAAGHPVP